MFSLSCSLIVTKWSRPHCTCLYVWVVGYGLSMGAVFGRGWGGDGIVNAAVQVNADVVAAGWIWSDNPLMPCSIEGEASCRTQAYHSLYKKPPKEMNNSGGRCGRGIRTGAELELDCY